jgi:cell division septal protein FtsQ
LVARAVQVDTNGTDKALARITLTNAAAMLDNAAANPALDATHRDAARTLANAYRTTTATVSGGTESDWQASLDDGNTKDAVMKKVCGGG